MERQYYYAESAQKPLAIEIGVSTVYLRANITKEKAIGTQTEPRWTYQEATLTLAEFNDHATEILISAQKNNDDNQLIIMNAIADLYDAMAKSKTI